MSETLIIGILSLTGTLVGSIGGILASARLTNFRIKALENKVDKHNNFASRLPVVENNIKNLNERIVDIERRLHTK